MAKLVKDINIEERNSRKYLNAFRDMGQALKTIFSTEKEIDSDEDIERQVIEMEKMSNKRISELEKFMQKEEEKAPKSQQKRIEKSLSNPRIKNKIHQKEQEQTQERVSDDEERTR